MRWRRSKLVMLSALAALLACHPALGGATPLTTVRVASGLNLPVFVTAPPEDFIRLFIVEKPGVIRILNIVSGRPNVTPFLDINSLVGGGNTLDDERGLLGLAFHPDYADNGFFYVNYTANGGTTTIARYSVSVDPDIADAGSGMTLLTISQPFQNHNAGWIAFGPNDGYLYIATGDGGDGCDPGTRAQDITNQLLGKMLRIDVDGDDFPGDPGRNYAIPPDNPFVDATGDDEIWAYGLRNPWRCSFDRSNGDLYIADVGQSAWEEVDFQPESSRGGQNYGWDCMEGNHCSSASGCDPGGCTCFAGSLVVPIHEYSHGGNPFRCSITGGYAYRGCAIADLQGVYFFSDFCSSQIWSFRYDGTNLTEFTDRTAELDPPDFSITSIASYGEDAYGELYIVEQSSSGEVYKIVPADGLQNDCNENEVEDACDILNGTSPDGDGNGVPDECAGEDCNSNGIPDEEELDTDGDGLIDDCDACPLDNPDDTDDDGVCDSQDICPGFDDTIDTDGDGVPDGCDLCPGEDDNVDCQPNGVPDACDISGGTSQDCNKNAVPDECEELCAIDADCDDGDVCTLDTCDCGNPEVDLDGCVHEYQRRMFGDIVPPFCTDPPESPCPQPGIDDTLCLLDDFADGVGVSGCGSNDPPESTDLFPCGGGDGMMNLDDILYMLDAFAGLHPCPDPCP